ncbi:MAG: iron-containing alcohol dehydrogenase [Planctomycetes bacterium]|nr:iron-containing alcohol dehydrogenase [Planctomycetota bacterium]
MRTIWNFYSAGRLVFGRGAVNELGSHVARRGWMRALVVTDPVLVEAGVVRPVEASLAEADVAVEIFDGGEPEPSLQAALRGVECAARFRPDVIVGVGGGSNMDLAKIVSVLFTHGGRPSDYFSWDNVPGPVTPLVGVPTTAGTGSEVSHAAVLTDTEQKIKVSTLSNYLRPALAVVDPELTLTCPPRVTADSGIDALTHAIEAYTATDYSALPPDESHAYDGAHPLGDVLAETAITLIARHLRTAVREPRNLAAREGMALAATLAGLAFSNCGVALVHALEYPLGGELHCSHGTGNGLLLPFVMRYNLPQRTARLARVAELLGEDIRGLDESQAAALAADAVEQLKRDIGIPLRIRDLGGREEQLPEFARKAFAIKRLMTINPRQPTEEDLLAILQEAW